MGPLGWIGDYGTAALLVIALRLLVPLLIIKRPLQGGIAAMLIDGADVILVDVFRLVRDDAGFAGHYHPTDKLLDMYYLSIEAVIAWRWVNQWARRPALALFALRVVGFLAFEFSGERIVLFIFPNMFENWWLYVVVVMRFFPKLVPHNTRTVAIPMALLLIPKMGQEYLLHYSEAQPWSWTKKHLL